MTYTEGWPKRLSLPTGTITDGAADFTMHEVVPLSDAERLRENTDKLLEDWKGRLHSAEADAERLREALERIAALDLDEAGLSVEAAKGEAHSIARAALDQEGEDFNPNLRLEDEIGAWPGDQGGEG
jgi:hypothetical protein